MNEEATTSTSAISRRALLQASGFGALVLTIPLIDGAPALAAAGAPAALRRASYLGLVGQEFAVSGGPALTLVAVDDVAGAKTAPQLIGSDDAFLLSLRGPASAPVSSAIHAFTIPNVGTAELFVSPVGATTGPAADYEIVIDRSVPLASAHRAAPEPPPAIDSVTAPPPAVGKIVAPAAIPAAAQGAFLRLKVTAHATRVGGHAVASLRFTAGTFQAVQVQLLRGGHRYAAGTAVVKHGRAAVQLHATRHLPRGRYDLVITATTTRGAAKSVVRSVTLR